MDEGEPIRRVLDALEEGHIPYMLTGSFASNYYGEPRTTHDIDFVVQISPVRAGQLETALGPDFVVSGAREAVTRRRHHPAPLLKEEGKRFERPSSKRRGSLVIFPLY